MKRIIIILCLVCSLSVCLAGSLGYALSGGGARGFAHIGVLKVLEEEGIRPQYISGTSIGAIIGALYAMGYSATEIESLATSVDWTQIFNDKRSRKDLYVGQKRWAPYGIWEFELDKGWKPQLPSSLYNVNSINLYLFEVSAAAAQVQNFEDLPIPFSCISTDLISGEPKIFRNGPIGQALRASMSIPSLMRPLPIDNRLYIDGGISQNLPIAAVRDLGAEVVLGIKVNTDLRKKEELTDLIDVLDQTINIGITRNLNAELDYCDLVLEPYLMKYSATDFKHIKQIIALGEVYARHKLEEIRNLKQYLDPHPDSSHVTFDKSLNAFKISQIEVVGNIYLSSVKIKEYLGLKLPGVYSPQDISRAATKAWNSMYFQFLYPSLEKQSDGSYLLKIHVLEKERKTLSLNNTYSKEVKLNASAVLSLNNMLLKNSRLLSELKLGGENELNVDYVKNFGEMWGIYYRIFGYINERTLYVYNEDHYRINSVKSLETGGTTGLGFFTKHHGIAEMYMYHADTYLYRGISETMMPPRHYKVTGMGIKGYHEMLNDYMFPTSGTRAIVKANFARDERFSDYLYSKVQGKAELYFPLSDKFNVNGSVDIGSYFNSAPEDKFDPFYLGGAEGFKGYAKHEISAPHYRIAQFGFTWHPLNILYLGIGTQTLNYADTELWGTDYSTEKCYYADLGLATKLMPIKLALALNERSTLNFMLNLGYDADIFRFSRK